VHFLGWRSDRKALLEACDICLLPSRYEPFGTVIAEAWSMRRPLVAAAADGARQYVRSGENGAVFPIDDAAALAAWIRQIAADPVLAARLVENGYREYERQFSREVVIDALLDIYRKAIATREG
jgi:glycosyltransferase involved in cell wall biosynthesis